MNITGSNDITLLRCKTTWDISGTAPQILIENLSQGNNLAGCSWWFVALAPGDIPIHEGSEANPDITGNWTDDTLNDSWPIAFNNILFSGATYSLQIFVKDSDGNVYAGDIQTASICRPAGNTKNSTNTYGLATCLVEVKCADGRVFFQDTTNATYQGIEGTQGSSVLRVTYPPDETGVVPDPFVGAHFSTALVPITYSSDSYQFQASSVYDYDFGGYVHIRIKYVSFNPVNGSPAIRFPVLCNINLCSLFCEVDKLVRDISTGNCNNAQEAQQKLNLINPKLWLITMGIQQPLCGVDVPALIEEVKAIGGFDCNCCNAPTGIIPTTASVIDGYNFEVVTECGDISGTVEKNGNNIQIQLSDVTYTFEMCDSSPMGTTAFEFRDEVVGCNKQVCLFVDVTQLSFDILNTIKTNTELVNLFNSIVVGGGAGNWNLVVDGKCIFTSGTTYDYSFGLSDIPANTTFAVLEKVQVNGIYEEANFVFNMTNLPALQTFLNTLGFGTFVVTAAGPTSITITSTANSTDIGGIVYTPGGGGTAFASMTKTASGFTPLTANQVVQAIINYLCNIDDSEVETSAAYEICWIDGDGVKQTTTVNSGSPLTAAIAAIVENGCTTIDYIVSLSSLNCANVKALFPQTISVMQANDVLLGTKSGDCAGIYPTEAFLAMLNYGTYNADVLAAFCNMVTLCAAGLACSPYNVFYAATETSSPGVDLVITFSHPDAVSNTIRYARIDNTVTPSYITIPGVLPGASPYTITGLDAGQYRVGITPVYADGRACGEVFYDTLPCEAPLAFNAVYDGTNIVITGTVVEGASAKVELKYPNGGSFSQIYSTTEGALSENITPPALVYGVFFATLKSVCDVSSGFFSAATAPASFEIPEPSP
jgi:hypothetical protein